MSSQQEQQQHNCEETRKAYRDFRLMAEESADLVILHNLDGTIRTSEVALKRLLGITVEDIDSRRFLHFVHPDDKEKVIALRKYDQGDQPASAIYRIRHPDGRDLWLETTARPLRDGETGVVTGFISTTRDVTVHKHQEIALIAAQQRAEAANLAKSRFLANMSHELRTPLNAIIGFSDLMRQGTFGPLANPRYEEYVTLVYDSGQLLLDLITDMLDMAKIEAGKMELNFEFIDVNDMINECARMMNERASAADIAIMAEPPQQAIILSADKRAVKQILLNLLTNAIKFTQPGGHVTVSASSTGDFVRLAVADNGIGIPAEILPRIGQPFERVHTDPHLAQGGTGLGLALVRALTGKHGGQMRIESSEGVGTRVEITLPLAYAKRATG